MVQKRVGTNKQPTSSQNNVNSACYPGGIHIRLLGVTVKTYPSSKGIEPISKGSLRRHPYHDPHALCKPL
jgi:hypothetical protein